MLLIILVFCVVLIVLFSICVLYPVFHVSLDCSFNFLQRVFIQVKYGAELVMTLLLELTLLSLRQMFSNIYTVICYHVITEAY